MKCLVCDFIASAQDELDIHASTHVSTANGSFVSVSEFSAQSNQPTIKLNSSMENVTPPVNYMQSFTEEKQCRHCVGWFSPELMGLHVEMAHRETLIYCTYCSKMFYSHKMLCAHLMEAHIPRYECQQCPFVTDTARKRRYHVMDVHENVRFNCPMCSYSAKRRYYLADHMPRHYVKTSAQ